MAYNVPIICVRWGVTPPKIIKQTKVQNMHTDSKKHDTPTDANNVLAEVPKRDFEWVCNECNFPNLTSSVSEDEIEQELHACINCGCFEMHKRYFR
jgi:hypothetical protein